MLGKTKQVQHVLTEQIYELAARRTEDLSVPRHAEKFWASVKTLKKLVEVNKLTRLVDCFESDGRIYSIMQVVGEQTLTNVMRTVYPLGCDEEFAQTTIATVCGIINEMHKRGIMHRRIETDVIGMKINRSTATASYAF